MWNQEFCDRCGKFNKYGIGIYPLHKWIATTTVKNVCYDCKTDLPPEWRTFKVKTDDDIKILHKYLQNGSLSIKNDLKLFNSLQQGGYQ